MKQESTKTTIYILGIISRYGQMHGYRLKQIIDQEIADFAKIKLANIYYQLNKMVERGYLTEQNLQKDNKEVKTYQITDKGRSILALKLVQVAEQEQEFEFLFDSVLYLREHIDQGQLKKVIENKIASLEQMIGFMEDHQQKTLDDIEAQSRIYADLIFQHHLTHYQAELKWLKTVNTELIH